MVHLESATASGTLPAGGVGGDGGHVLNSTNLQASTGQGSQSRLSTRAGGLGAVATGGSHLNVYGGDAQLLGLGGSVHGGKHGSVRGGLITISLHLHATSDTGQSLTTRQIGDVLRREKTVRQKLK